jgi:hypothetical protein
MKFPIKKLQRIEFSKDDLDRLLFFCFYCYFRIFLFSSVKDFQGFTCFIIRKYFIIRLSLRLHIIEFLSDFFLIESLPDFIYLITIEHFDLLLIKINQCCRKKANNWGGPALGTER